MEHVEDCTGVVEIDWLGLVICRSTDMFSRMLENGDNGYGLISIDQQGVRIFRGTVNVSLSVLKLITSDVCEQLSCAGAISMELI